MKFKAVDKLTDNEIYFFGRIFENSNLYKSFINDGQDSKTVVNDMGIFIKNKYQLTEDRIYVLHRKLKYFGNCSENDYCTLHKQKLKDIKFYLEVMQFILDTRYDDNDEAIVVYCKKCKIQKLYCFESIKCKYEEIVNIKEMLRSEKFANRFAKKWTSDAIW